jgi:Ca-activated chloride channel homolog
VTRKARRMRWLWGAAALLCFAVPVTSGATQVSEPVFRTGVDLVFLNVTVTGPGNRPVPDLDARDFTVLEGGAPQELAYFSRARVPLAASVLVDTSGSMYQTLGLAQDAAVAFVRRMEPDDLAQVIEFNSSVQIAQPFTRDRGALEAAIYGMSARGSTALYNALYIALRELQRIRAEAPDEIRRHAVVLLSDGEDTSSILAFEDVIDTAKRSNIAIYTIGLRSAPAIKPARLNDGEFVLREFARATGGRAFFSDSPRELAAIYGEVVDELATQYTLAYVPSAPRKDGQWRTISVRVARPNVVARTRSGYFADSR